MGKYNSKYDEYVEIEELMPEGYEDWLEEENKNFIKKWDDLEKQAEKEKSFCKCGTNCKPKHVIVSKAVQFWVCDKCKKECKDPNEWRDPWNNGNDMGLPF